MRGNEQIVGRNHLAALLQIGSNLRVVERRVVVEVERVNVGEECAERGRVLRLPWYMPRGMGRSQALAAGN